MSKRHAAKILCPITGIHRFQSEQEISVSLWGKVKKCDLHRLLLSAVDDSATLKAQWQRQLQYFHEVDIPNGMIITKIIQQYRRDGHSMSIPRTIIPAITMQTHAFLRELTSVHKVNTFLKAEVHVKERQSNYKLLIC